jgi:hypothetical protein
MPRRLLLPLSILLVLAASACEVRTTVDVAVAEDGSGEVAVTVRLDDEALARVPDVDDDGTSGLADLAALVRTEDLVAAGWTVGEPAESGEGGAALRVTRPFGTPDEADTILAELTGPSGVLRDLDVSRSTSFGRTELGFSGTADLSGGLEAFGDEGLAAALDGEPVGQDAAAIEAAAGVPLAEAVTFEITADLDELDPGARRGAGDHGGRHDRLRPAGPGAGRGGGGRRAGPGRGAGGPPGPLAPPGVRGRLGSRDRRKCHTPSLGCAPCPG